MAAADFSQNGAPYLLPSASRRSDGRPRFTLALDPVLAGSDHGLRFLIQQETRFDGFERASREVIDAHLKPGDLFIDAGAHVGAISLSAATAPATTLATGVDNRVLAIEPAPDNLRQLAASIAANGMGQRITLVPAALGAASGRSRLRLTRGSMGYRLGSDDAGAIAHQRFAHCVDTSGDFGPFRAHSDPDLTAGIVEAATVTPDDGHGERHRPTLMCRGTQKGGLSPLEHLRSSSAATLRQRVDNPVFPVR